MYKSISIENFRCFENTKIEGFEQINLIGGQNNAGKTALLEALYLGGEPWENTIQILLNNRDESLKLYEKAEEQPFKNFFYRQNENKAITITIEKYNLPTRKTDVTSSVYTENQDDDLIERAALKIEGFDDNILIHNSSINTMLNNERRIIPARDFIDKIIFIPARGKASDFGSVYKKIVIAGNKEYLLDAFRLIEPEIIEVEYITNQLLLMRKGENLMPINVFGDAMMKLCTIVMPFILGKHKIILIDEIENGIHHANQRKFWKMLFDLAKKFDIQVFATSHSAEMIAAFQDVGKNKESVCKAKYFELTKDQDTNKIIANPLNMDMLQYEILKKQPFRGE